ncbi:MAG: 4-hydroxy-tetrahydrodipicolinate reductase [Nitrospirota bacterium]|nr:4-hydroxy-tetrahydrodipicolinate reductase [Nitrospirota bacterium]
MKIAVTGAAGRMGQRIIACISDTEGVQLAGAIERPGSPALGKDAGEVAGIGRNGVVIVDSLEKALAAADVLIDFTSAEASLVHLKTVASLGKAIVIGSTGFSAAQMEEVKGLTKNTSCVLAPNMSVGVNVLLKALDLVARTLGDDYDVEIVEAHHRLKKDAPSGTAMKIAQVLASSLDRNLDEVAVYERKGLIGERTQKEIGIQTIRGGDIVGDHTVYFATMGERLEFTHRASSRDTFARGSIRAAQWLAGRGFGLFDMQDVLGLKGNQ